MVALLAPLLILATVSVLVQRGREGHWPSLRWRGLALLALGMQLLLFNPPVDSQLWAVAWGRWVGIASMLAVLAVLVRNGRDAGVTRLPWLVAALGLGLNVLVMSANDGLMPRSEEALHSTGRLPRPEWRLTNVAPLRPETNLPWLGDIIPEPDWLPLTNVVSVGDLLLSAGTAWAVLGRRHKCQLRQRG
jgi:Family of unknown function (DUF5317)